MKTLTIKLTGPLQSYGNQATFSRRTSYHYPSKSALIGMIAAALGYRRDDSRISNLNQLKVAVRIDQPGQTMTDFQIIEYDRAHQKRSLSYRDYLQDAVFIAAISGNSNKIEQINNALHHPKFQLSLGRRANVPAGPLKTKIFDNQDPVSVLKNSEWQASEWYQKRKGSYLAEIIADADLLPDKASTLVKDKVGSFDQAHRWHQYRAVVTLHVKLANSLNNTDHDVMASL
ncbi:type I-E CRISPR-associated protein Cas5/CasD [Limosilactobacillus kribbianus]|uniref:type I-E CRISPR-associated protein Cas5/CasD n=1 Tax=Limosilactobacillus kribbianus TaxID=2982695 RepID=UPI0022653947|nr:type I-E CRISPR-associated protein Cas5/CasD [Limosilactobacillus kribbianus]